MELQGMNRCYTRVTGRNAYMYAYSPADTEADTRYVFANHDRNYRGDKRAAKAYMRSLLDEARAIQTEAVYDVLRANSELRLHTNRLRAQANAHDLLDDTLGATVIKALMDAAATFHPETGESAKNYGTASIDDVRDVMSAAGVEIGETDVPQLDDLVSQKYLGRMIRHAHTEGLERKGYAS